MTQVFVMKQGCYPDPPKKYRYALWRVWDKSRPRLVSVGLNPSTADARTDDKTVKRCIGFARKLGYGSLFVVNLFALRSSHPDVLYEKSTDPVGPENLHVIKRLLRKADCVLVGWGNHGTYLKQNEIVLKFIKKPMCLKTTRKGQPSHPLYLRANLKPIPFTAR